MSRSRWFLALLFFSSLPLAAQTRVAAGLSIGSQSYAAHEDNPRYLPGLELLVHRRAWGGHLAAEYADLSVGEGPLVAIHTDVVHRIGDDRFSVLLGAGPTLILRNSPKDVVWNAEIDASYGWSRAEVFARLRYYDYELEEFRFGGDAGPDGPAVYVGMRFKLRP